MNVQDWLKDPKNIYIGRQTPYLEGSKWGNPYTMHEYRSRPKVIKLYENHLQENMELRNSVHQLTGKILGHWCSPQPCHSEILHLLAGNNPVYQMTDTDIFISLLMPEN